MRVVVTRPRGDAEALAARLAARGIAMGRDAAAEPRAQAGPALCRALGLGGA